MRISNKIKKFSTLLDILHSNIDLTRYYIMIYNSIDNFNRPIYGSTSVDVRSVNIHEAQVIALSLVWTERTEYFLEIPDHICKRKEIVELGHRGLKW